MTPGKKPGSSSPSMASSHFAPGIPRSISPFANFAMIWDGVFGLSPRHEAFSCVSTEACNPGPTTDDSCEDSDHHFYWFIRCVFGSFSWIRASWNWCVNKNGRHPSRVTHKIMADYVLEVLDNCRVA